MSSLCRIASFRTRFSSSCQNLDSIVVPVTVVFPSMDIAQGQYESHRFLKRTIMYSTFRQIPVSNLAQEDVAPLCFGITQENDLLKIVYARVFANGVIL